MTKVLVSGSIAYDRIMDFNGLFKDHFLPDQLHSLNLSFQVDTVAENFGGCSGNIAYNLRLLGETPFIIAVAGNDFTRYEAYLRGLGIDTSSIHVNETLPTSIAFIMTDKADNQLAAFSMGAGNTSYTPLPDLADTGCGIVSAGNPEDMRTLPEHYRKGAVPFFYDPGQALPVLSGEDVQKGMQSAAAVLGNDYEFKLLSEKTGWSETEMLAHAGALIVTLGEQGSRIVTKEGEQRIRAVSAQVMDPTGAGDAYRAGFVAGYLAKLPLRQCAMLGSTVAAYAVERYGTQNHSFTREELSARYREAYNEEYPLN